MHNFVKVRKWVIKENLKNKIKFLLSNFIFFQGPFIILCQLGKIKNTKGHKYENRNRCRAIC